MVTPNSAAVHSTAPCSSDLALMNSFFAAGNCRVNTTMDKLERRGIAQLSVGDSDRLRAEDSVGCDVSGRSPFQQRLGENDMIVARNPWIGVG